MRFSLLLLTLFLTACFTVTPDQAQRMQGQLEAIQESVQKLGTITAEVTHVVDGDTIMVLLPEGTEESVRLIGIDTPEREKCMATEATARLQELVGGRSVLLIPKPGEDRDDYGRLLRYVEADEDVGAVMLREGLAEDFPWFEHSRAQEYREHKRQAK